MKAGAGFGPIEAPVAQLDRVLPSEGRGFGFKSQRVHFFNFWQSLTMTLSSNIGEIEIVNEGAYSFGSPDNVRKYPFEQNFADRRHASVHGILINGVPLAVFGAGMGATGVHQHSAKVVEIVSILPWVIESCALSLIHFNLGGRLKPIPQHASASISKRKTMHFCHMENFKLDAFLRTVS